MIMKTPGLTIIRYKIHWHVVSTHFPVSFFLGSAVFMILHLFSNTSCFELAAYVALIGGAVMMVPTTISGWSTWKGRYKGTRGKIFLYKVRISLAMIGLSFFLVIWRTIFSRAPEDIWLTLYAIGVFLLLAGSAAEGYYGGRLNHR